MSRICIMLLAISAALALCCSVTNAQRRDARPNIVFILADDYGWRDLSCYGSGFYQTPNLDALAAQGMRFTNAYAACNVCSPTRASIMTGKYPARLHLTDWLPGRPDMPTQKLNRPQILQHLPLEETTIAQAFKEAGYATGFIGKWHLGGPNFYPDKQGFEVNIAGCQLGSPPSYFSPYKIPTLLDGPEGEYLTDRLTDEAVQFIGDHKDKPFFLYLAHYAVHNPQQAKANLLETWADLVSALPADEPEFAMDWGRKVRQVQNRPVYAAMIQSLDESVGRITKTLADLSLEKNTIVVFTSDNGGLSTAEGTPTSNLPLRMGKGWNYEGGIREPLIVRWSGMIKPASVCSAPMISTDYYPTLLEAAGLPMRLMQHIDGVSILPLLKGDHLRERPVFWHYPHYSNQGGPPSGAVRLGNFKLIEFYEDDHVELYDLSHDISEKKDLADTMPEKAKALREMLHDWRKDVDAQMPTPNPDFKTDATNKTGKQAVIAAGSGIGLGPLDDD